MSARILATIVPLFLRVKIKRCGVDGKEVRRHVGLAQSMAPGRDGLALASVLGPKVEPVVVMDDWPEINICHACERTLTVQDVAHRLLERAKKEERSHD